ncbi:MAG: DNA translocase FtsK 4TM domain-containing protein [Deltaproteobacteria bacterium]|nr:DNA translocase FtsK 4TM domain-containing protein [Deltaproteobacteria bacterium]
MKNTEPTHRKIREIGAIILGALALFLLIAFLSYDVNDPSFTHFVSGSPKITNRGGMIGSYVADSALRLFGVTAYLFPLMLLFCAAKLFINKTVKMNIFFLLSFATLVGSTATIIAARYDTLFFFGAGRYPEPGGFIGACLMRYLVPYFSSIGTYLLTVTVLIMSLIVTLDISITDTARGIASLASLSVRKIRTFIQIRMERRKRKKKAEEFKRRQGPDDILVITEKKPVKDDKAKLKTEQAVFNFMEHGEFTLPPVSLLDKVDRTVSTVKKESLVMNARLLEKKLEDFGVEAKVVEITPGPVITMYELEPAPGVKINRITNLADDLALALKAQGIRVIAPIPGKAAIGVEIPNNIRELVCLRDVVDFDDFLNTKYKLPIALGKDIVGNPVLADLARMPHLLIAGTTGSGKSVSLNAMICSILLKSLPDRTKLLMIDPKRLELSGYEGIPHLIHPVVFNPKKAAQVLKWAVDEMERRYRIISEVGLKSIDRYNSLIEKGEVLSPLSAKTADEGQGTQPPLREILPYIVIIIDELADLMMVAQRHVEESLTRLAQMARAAGIHLIIATQRPSVDVITGIIKANFPTRISFQVSSKVDSRTILDQMGAEKLLGAGDMLFVPPGTSKLTRIHGAYVSDKEIERIVTFVKTQGPPRYDETINQYKDEPTEERFDKEDYDEKYDEAVELVTDLGHASISLVQRYLKIGYNRAARIVERMESEGIVGPADGAKPRKILAEKLPE